MSHVSNLEDIGYSLAELYVSVGNHISSDETPAAVEPVMDLMCRALITMKQAAEQMEGKAVPFDSCDNRMVEAVASHLRMAVNRIDAAITESAFRALDMESRC